MACATAGSTRCETPRARVRIRRQCAPAQGSGGAPGTGTGTWGRSGRARCTLIDRFGRCAASLGGVASVEQRTSGLVRDRNVIHVAGLFVAALRDASGEPWKAGTQRGRRYAQRASNTEGRGLAYVSNGSTGLGRRASRQAYDGKRRRTQSRTQRGRRRSVRRVARDNTREGRFVVKLAEPARRRRGKRQIGG